MGVHGLISGSDTFQKPLRLDGVTITLRWRWATLLRQKRPGLLEQGWLVDVFAASGAVISTSRMAKIGFAIFKRGSNRALAPGEDPPGPGEAPIDPRLPPGELVVADARRGVGGMRPPRENLADFAELEYFPYVPRVRVI